MLSKYVYDLSLGHFVVDFSQGALAALLPLLIAQHHFNYAIAATLVFAMNLVSSIIQPLFGFLSDRFHTGWIIIPALLITGLGFGTLGWDSQYFLLITSCLVCGGGIAAYHPDAAKLVNGLADVNQGHAMSVFSLVVTWALLAGRSRSLWSLTPWGFPGLASLSWWAAE
ncbi:MFS transporter [Limosilactobacillus fermentum]|uniref:MFS transporter n=1 Tax=Limosilactobacillus fermentum TaxID=1613 RepID=UPI0021A655E3|nr:MFS transporter [Limosilactobacillus fermentum]MCT2870066.1 MFS transporter [Limosilactobacillus fermentum]